MVMNNDGSGNILRQDSLLHPHQWSSDFKTTLGNALDIEPSMLRGPDDLGYFDVIATNPPFGSKLPVKDRETLGQYKLAHVWEKSQSGWYKPTDQLQTSVPPEILFIERCWQFLRPGGRLAIVLPDAILGAPGLLYVRHWILTYSRLVASVDLHPDTFQPRNGTQTSVLILQKKSEQEITEEAISGHLKDYNVLMAQVNAIGHDKRGNKTYKRNDDGEEILVEQDRTLNRGVFGVDYDGPLPRQKAVDDDTPEVVEEFLKWKSKEVLGW